MTDTTARPATTARLAPGLSNARLRRRQAAERRFKAYGLAAILLALAILTILLVSIVSKGHSAFVQTEVALEVNFDPALIDPQGTRDRAVLEDANYRALLFAALADEFPEASSRSGRRDAQAMFSNNAPFRLRDRVLEDPSIIGTTQRVWFTASADIDSFEKGYIPRDVPESDRRIKDNQVAWFDTLVAQDAVRTVFNSNFFTSADSREPEQAGIRGAIVGSVLTLLITLVLAFPVGVMAAVYLEEFAPKNRWTDLIEVNINNLAAVPSIVFGLLGLAVFLNFFGLPRSAPLVGGMVLALITLPTIIIAGRAALKAVPPSIREAALGMGASPLQTVTHHVLPLAMPGIMTGAIIGMAQALGETAPLLMIGMVAFIVDVPGGFTDAATVLPVQIFLWADAPERGFIEKTSAAIMVLLAFLIVMNMLAVLLRKKFERRW
jgi:phosphate transport system permease protein